MRLLHVASHGTMIPVAVSKIGNFLGVGMKTVDYMDKVMRVHSIPSDYALAKVLGVTKQTVSRYRAGIGQFDDAVALRVAHLLNVEPGIVLIDMHAERTKNDDVRTVWEQVSAGFPALLLQAKSAREALPCW